MLSGWAPIPMAWCHVSIYYSSSWSLVCMEKWTFSLIFFLPSKLLSSTIRSACWFHFLMQWLIIWYGVMMRWEAGDRSRLVHAAKIALSVHPYLWTYGKECAINFYCSWEYLNIVFENSMLLQLLYFNYHLIYFLSIRVKDITVLCSICLGKELQ